jgi:hypothetical protein
MARRNGNGGFPQLASDRTMVDTPRPSPLAKFQDSIGVVIDWKNETCGMAKTSHKTEETHLQTVGWISRPKSSRPPVKAELFFLTSLFTELIDWVVGVNARL